MISAETLALLARYDTPTISNTIELFDVIPRTEGYTDARIRANLPDAPPAVGFASTATMRCAMPRESGAVYNSLDQQIADFAELPGPAMVVFQDLDEPAVAATFGEIMCSTYQAFGAVGLVTSGPARDLDQVKAIRFPTWSNSAICSHGYSHIVDIHVTVRVGGMVVRPGDLLHADLNGVASIPLSIAADVAGAAAEYMAAEAIVLDHLKSGDRDPKRYSEARQATVAAITALGQRVRAKR